MLEKWIATIRISFRISIQLLIGLIIFTSWFTYAAEPEQCAPVTSINIIDNSVLQKDFQDLGAKYKNAERSCQNLKKIAQEATEIYIANGYITSQVISTTDCITCMAGHGRVELRAIEGFIHEFSIEGDSGNIVSNDKYEDWVKLGTSRPFSKNDMEETLRMIRASNSVKSVEGTLSRAREKKNGASRLSVKIVENNRLKATLAANNYLSPTIGNYLTYLDLNYSNPFKLTDTVSARYAQTPEKDFYTIGFGYILPLNFHKRSLVFSANHSRSTVPDFFGGITQDANSRSFHLQYRQSILDHITNNLSVNVSLKHHNGATILTGDTLQSTNLKLLETENITTIAGYGVTYNRQHKRAIFSAHGKLNKGLDWLNAGSNPDNGAKFDFISVDFSGSVTYFPSTRKSWRIATTVKGKLSPHRLPSSEKFYLGGPDFLRGYTLGAVSGDYGYLLSFEANIPLVLNERGRPKLLISPFIDGGITRTQNINLTDDDPIASAGVAIHWKPIRRVSFDISYAQALVDVNTSLPSNNLQSDGLYLSLSLRYFD